MLQKTIQWLDKRVESERMTLAAGEKPRPRIKNRIQRIAIRALAGFFILMLVFTLVSRMADSIAVARVRTDTVKSAVLNDRVTLNGAIEPLGDLQLSLPGGIIITAVKVSAGQQVKTGDVLMELDQDNVNGQLDKLREKLRILELRLAAADSGVSGNSANEILAAQQAVKQAQADDDRLKEKLDRADQRAEEDLRDARAALNEASAAYGKAVEKARADLIKAAGDKLKAAQASLESVQESADDAISSAQYAYASALEQKEAAKQAYINAVNNVHRAEKRLSEAKQRLNELGAADPPDPDAIAAARVQVQAAQAELDAANSTLESLSDEEPADYERAKETLKKTKEKWQKKIAEAEDAVKEAEAELKAAKAKSDMTDQSGVIAAQGNTDSAERAVKSAQRALEDHGQNSGDQLIAAQRAIETAQRNLEQAQRQAADSARNDQKARQQAEIERLSYLSDQRTLEKSIADLEKIVRMGGKLVSPIDGKILSAAERGTIQEGAAAAVISRNDLGFSFTARVDQKTVDKLVPGDKGTLAYTSEGRSNQADAVITSIGAADDKGQVTVTAGLPEGMYPSGAPAEMTVTQSSEKQNTCLPLSALRNDSNGDYVLVIREKRTVMGLEQTAVRTPVTVTARDSEMMAISSSLMADNPVIVNANKPISEGDRVRLETE